MVTYFTDKQLEIEKILSNLGFVVEMEKTFGKYCVDLWVPECDWVVEIDGPQHYNKKNHKRDVDLFAMGVKCITHLASDIGDEKAKIILESEINRYGKEIGGDYIEKRVK